MVKQKTKRGTSLTAAAAVAMLVMMAAGCGTPRGPLYPELNPPLVWPRPPEKARIRYVGQFSTEDDLKREVSMTEAIGRLVFGRNPQGVLARPHAVVTDGRDTLYIADSTGSVIHMMDLKNRRYRQFFRLTETERLISPIGLAVLGDRLFVADSIRAEICVFDLQGTFQFSFGSDLLRRPSGLACSAAQQVLYVADAKLHTLFIFDVQGHYRSRIGGQDGDEQRFHFPTGVWVDRDDKLYVSDTLNYRVQVFSPQGRYLFSVGQHGDRPGCFAHPFGIATDSFGNLYVGDKQFENIQIFSPQGDILMAFGNEGTGAGEFWLPAGIFIDPENRIYVADSFNKRIQVFQLLEGQRP